MQEKLNLVEQQLQQLLESSNPLKFGRGVSASEYLDKLSRFNNDINPFIEKAEEIANKALNDYQSENKEVFKDKLSEIVKSYVVKFTKHYLN